MIYGFKTCKTYDGAYDCINAVESRNGNVAFIALKNFGIDSGRLQPAFEFYGFFFVNDRTDLRPELVYLVKQSIYVTAAGERFNCKIGRRFPCNFKGLLSD